MLPEHSTRVLAVTQISSNHMYMFLHFIRLLFKTCKNKIYLCMTVKSLLGIVLESEF